MTDLVAFLRARLDEDEAIATAPLNASPRGWQRRGCEVLSTGCDDVMPDGSRRGSGIQIYDEGSHEEGDAEHIAHFDPPRELREVEAKRKILDAYERAPDWPGGEDVRWLASIYSDHPDYDPAWSA